MKIMASESEKTETEKLRDEINEPQTQTEPDKSVGKTCFLCKRDIGFFKSGASKKWIENYGGIPPEGMGDKSVLCHECLTKTYEHVFTTKKKSFKVRFKNQSNLTIVMGIFW